MSDDTTPKPVEDGTRSLAPIRIPIAVEPEPLDSSSFIELRHHTLYQAGVLASLDVPYPGFIKAVKGQPPVPWYMDRRTAKAQALVIDDYRDSKRRYGNVLLTAHPFGTAHRMWELSHDPIIYEKLRELEVSPLLLTTTMLLHDYVESRLLQALRAVGGIVERVHVDRAGFESSLTRTWEPSKSLTSLNENKFIVDNVWWMTDALDKKGAARIYGQMVKCFPNVRGIEFVPDSQGGRTPLYQPMYFISEHDTNILASDCRIPVYQQLLRFIDKLDNLLRDVAQRKAFRSYRAECLEKNIEMPTERKALRAHGVPDDMVQECYEQALMKSFVLLFPDVPDEFKAIYRAGMYELGKEALKLMRARKMGSPQPDQSYGEAPHTAGPRTIWMPNDGPDPKGPTRSARHYGTQSAPSTPAGTTPE